MSEKVHGILKNLKKKKKRGIKRVGIIVAELLVLSVNPHLVNQEAKS